MNLNNESYHSPIGFLTSEYLGFLKLQVVSGVRALGYVYTTRTRIQGYLISNLLHDSAYCNRRASVVISEPRSASLQCCLKHTSVLVINKCFFIIFFCVSVPTSATCILYGCFNGGTCLTDASGESRCSCTADYIGPYCTELISCTGDTSCLGSGSCKVYQGQNYCDCADDLTGFSCDLDVSPGEPTAKFLIFSVYHRFPSFPPGVRAICLKHHRGWTRDIEH